MRTTPARFRIEIDPVKEGAYARSVKGWFLLCAALLTAGGVFGQTPEDALQDLKTQLKIAQDALAKQQALIERLQARVEELERADGKKAWDTSLHPGRSERPAPVAQALSAGKNGSAQPPSVAWKDGRTTVAFSSAEIAVSNRLQFRWTGTDPGDPAQTDTGAFDVRRFKTQVEGWVHSRDLTYKLQVDWTRSNHDSGILDDAYVDYDFTHGRGLFRLRAGQFKTPFGRQSIAPTKSDMFVDRSFVSSLFSRIRDVGLMAHGHFGPSSVPDMIEYDAGVFNGGGQGVYTNPDGKVQTDLRLVVSPWGSAGYDESNPYGTAEPRLSLGIDYEHNDQRVRDSKANLYASGTEYTTTGYDLMFKYQWLTVYGEYFDRLCHDGRGARTESSGVNAQVGLLLVPRRLEVFLGRWTFDPAYSNLGDRRTATGIGATWYFRGNAYKLQADYQRLEDQTAPFRTHVFRVQYQFMF